MKKDFRKDPVIQFVVDLAKKSLKPERVILYGSRARGDFKAISDYDLAFDLDERALSGWSRFSLDVQDNAPTLKQIDLVCLQKVDEDFKKRILKEGVVVYASKK